MLLSSFFSIYFYLFFDNASIYFNIHFFRWKKTDWNSPILKMLSCLPERESSKKCKLQLMVRTHNFSTKYFDFFSRCLFFLRFASSFVHFFLYFFLCNIYCLMFLIITFIIHLLFHMVFVILNFILPASFSFSIFFFFFFRFSRC